MLFLNLLQLLPALAVALPAYNQEDPLELTVGIHIQFQVWFFGLLGGPRSSLSDPTLSRDVGMLQHVTLVKTVNSDNLGR